MVDRRIGTPLLMTLTQLVAILFPPGAPKPPTADQEAILRHAQGPAWVLAGPGSGKTQVLTLLVLRLLYVENDAVQALAFGCKQCRARSLTGVSAALASVTVPVTFW